MKFGKKLLAFTVTFLMIFGGYFAAPPVANATGTLTGTATLSGGLERTYQWSIQKEVDVATWNLFEGDQAESNYTVSVDKGIYIDKGKLRVDVSVTNTGINNTSNLTINGKLYRKNANDADLVTTFSIDTDDNPELTPNETGDYFYIYTLTTEDAARSGRYYATVDISIDNNSGSGDVLNLESNEFSYLHNQPTTVNDTIHVIDSNIASGAGSAADPWTFNKDGSQTYKKTFDATDSGVFPNTATIIETDQTASESVTINRYNLGVSKTANASYTRTYDWSIDKTGSLSSVDLEPGATASVDYTVTVDATSADSAYGASGVITITNPAPIEAIINSVADVLPGSTALNIEAADFPLTIAAHGSRELHYTATLPDDADRQNTATAVLQNHKWTASGKTAIGTTQSFSGTANVVFGNPTTVIDENAEVTDDQHGDLGDLTAGVDSLPATYNYSMNVGPYSDRGAHQFDNTATVTATDTDAAETDSWRVTTNVLAGNLRINKNVLDGQDDTTPFPITVTDSAGNTVSNGSFNLSDDGFNTLSLFPGDYIITEGVVPTGYVFTSIASQDSVADNSLGTQSIKVHVSDGETTVVDIANRKLLGNLTVNKNVLDGQDDTTPFPITVTDSAGNTVSNGSFDLSDDGFNTLSLTPGDYIITEGVVPTGYVFTSIASEDSVSDDSLAPQSIKVHVSDGVTAVVNVTNRKLLGNLTVNKNVIDGQGDKQSFSFTITGPKGYSHSFDLADGGSEPIGNLIPGDYIILEGAAPAGYAFTSIASEDSVSDDSLAPQSIKVHVSDGATAVVNVTNRKLLGDLTIIKDVIDGQGDRQTFSFTVTGPGDYSHSFNLADGGSEPIGNLTPGDYIITEGAAPAGYAFTSIDSEDSVSDDSLAPQSIKVHVSDGEATVVNVTNRKLFGDLEITKTVLGGLDAGVSFTITVTKPDSTTETFNLPDDASALTKTLSHLPVGSYTVSESAIPAGYAFVNIDGNSGSQSVTVQVVDREKTSVSIINRKLNTIHLVKVDNLGGALAGVQFAYTNNDGQTWTALESLTDANGFVDIHNLDYGVYKIREVSVPAGYALSAAVETVNLSEAAGETRTVNFVNNGYGRIVITKYIEGTETKLSGATFKVSRVGSSPEESYIATDSDNDGVLTFSNLLIGQWVISEVAAPAGYHLSTATVTATVTVNADSLVSYSNQLDVGSLRIHKTNAANNQPVGGVQFQVSSNGVFEGQGAALVALPNDGKTDANGDLLVTGLVPGTYWVREINPADHYDIDVNDVREVTVAFNEVTPVEYENYPVGQVSITKLDRSEQGVALEGAVFAIYSDAELTRQVGANLTTGDNGKIASAWLSFGGDKPSTYYVKEITPPAGYKLSGDVQSVTFTEPGQVAAVTFRNDPADGSLIIKKVDKLTELALAGAEFKLYSDEALTLQVGNTLTTGADGIVRWDNLAPGTYYLKETKAPTDYELLADALPMTVVAGVTNPEPIVITNQHNPPQDIQTGSLIIKKVDALNRSQALAGAQFKLYSDEGTTHQVGGTLTTGSNGIARWDGLEPGTYYLKETKAPTNYDLLAVALPVTVVAGVTNPEPIVITNQYNPPQDIQTGMMDWNILLIGGLVLLAGLLLVAYTRKRRTAHVR